MLRLAIAIERGRSCLFTDFALDWRQFHHLGIFSTALVRKKDVAWDEHFERRCVELLDYVDCLYAEAGAVVR